MRRWQDWRTPAGKLVYTDEPRAKVKGSNATDLTYSIGLILGTDGAAGRDLRLARLGGGSRPGDALAFGRQSRAGPTTPGCACSGENGLEMVGKSSCRWRETAVRKR